MGQVGEDEGLSAYGSGNIAKESGIWQVESEWFGDGLAMEVKSWEKNFERYLKVPGMATNNGTLQVV